MATANVFKFRRSSVPGKAPTTSDIELGELAINTHDGYVYLKQSDGTGDKAIRFVSDQASQDYGLITD
jgi:hypothetical protein